MAQGCVELWRGIVRDWRSSFDFDAPGLTIRQRLERLEYAAMQSSKVCTDDGGLQELEFAQAECRQLLERDSLEVEAGGDPRVRQRVDRIERIVVYYEGNLSRLNRRFWWIPFGVGLLVLGACLLRCVVGL